MAPTCSCMARPSFSGHIQTTPKHVHRRALFDSHRHSLTQLAINACSVTRSFPKEQKRATQSITPHGHFTSTCSSLTPSLPCPPSLAMRTWTRGALYSCPAASLGGALLADASPLRTGPSAHR